MNTMFAHLMKQVAPVAGIKAGWQRGSRHWGGVGMKS